MKIKNNLNSLKLTNNYFFNLKTNLQNLKIINEDLYKVI